jgi:hypothetical protein
MGEDVESRAAQTAGGDQTAALASMLRTFACEIETDTGRAYAPAYMREAAKRLDRMDIALHRIAGHGNITGERARQIAADALDVEKPG